jgi:hypothetical protein
MWQRRPVPSFAEIAAVMDKSSSEFSFPIYRLSCFALRAGSPAPPLSRVGFFIFLLLFTIASPLCGFFRRVATS